MRSFALVIVTLFLVTSGFAQQVQTSDVANTQPLYSVNAKYVEGVGPGYWPTAGSGLTLNLAKGTAFCSGAVATYAGGTLTMTNNTTNYVYLNTSSSCVPAVKTSTFTSSDITIAVVVTSGGVIIPNGITDDRTWFVPGGGCGSLTLTGDVTSSGCATTLPNIVTASTQTKITYNAKGQVTAGAQAQFSDIGGTAAVSQGGTGTGSTLTGIVRGSASAFTAAELSGDVTTSGSNATTLGANFKRRGISFTIGDPAGSALTTGSTVTDYVTVPFGCTISAYNLAIDAGTITVKFWKIATGTAIPTSSNSINTSGVSISSGTAIHSTTVSDFTTTTVTQNDILAMNVTAVSTAKYVNGVLECDQ